MKPVHEWVDGHKAVLWVLGAIKQLHAFGVLTDGGPISPAGLADWDQLHASGYRPFNEKIRAAIHVIYDQVESMTEQDKAKLYAMVCMYKDYPEWLETSDQLTPDSDVDKT